jgi:formylglycine-generating enzyme required for sulfatase activity
MLAKRSGRFWGGALLSVLLAAAGAGAQETGGKEPGARDALEQMRLKLEKEEMELERLSEMVFIPAGSFDMGSASGAADEKPVHRVSLDGFYISKYEVTQLQYEKWMGENPSYFKNCPLCPVERVTHAQANAYCLRVGQRLPTEAEWERAAHGGVGGEYSWGEEHGERFAWFGNNSGQRPRPVGTRKANAFGLHDMAGNVWEWVADWYDEDYYRVSPAENPTGPRMGKQRVARGGGWGHSPEQIRHSLREHFDPRTRYINGGFRCAASKGKP